MGILSGLERRLRGAVDGTFARIFGGSVQPAEVTAALQREAAAGVTNQAGRAVAPNSFTVELGPSDSADVGDTGRVSNALAASIDDYVRGQGWETFAPVQVTLRESDRLHTGQFRVSSLVDPGVTGNEYDDPAASPGQGYPPAPGAPPRYGERPVYERQPDPFAILPGSYGPPEYEDPRYGAQGYGPPEYGDQGYESQDYPEYGPQDPDDAAGSGPQQSGYAAAPIPSAAYPQPPNAPAAYPQAPYPPQSAQPPNTYPVASAAAETGPHLVVQDGTGRSYVLHRGSNIVGRGQSAALRLADTAVSREHLDVYFDGQAAIVHDLGSTNGTAVNGSPVQTWQLADGDVIRLGTSAVTYLAR